ncbi:hypothetical protein C1J01_48430, partial [Nonomuraea aridisoli]
MAAHGSDAGVGAASGADPGVEAEIREQGSAGRGRGRRTQDRRAAERRAQDVRAAERAQDVRAGEETPLGVVDAEAVAAREAGVPIKTAESRRPAAGKPIDTEALRRLRRL